MLHPWPQVSGYVDEEMDGDRGPQTVMWSKEFYETDPSRGFVRGYTLQFGRGTGPVNEAITNLAPAACPGARTITAPIARSSTVGCWRASPARTCRRSTTA